MAKTETKAEVTEGFLGVLLKTRDLQKLVEFYTKVIGLKVLDQDEECADLDLKGGRHLLLRKDPKAESGYARCSFVLKVKDASAAHKTLAAAKAAGLSEPKDMQGVRVVACSDPDGNVIELAEISESKLESMKLPRPKEKQTSDDPKAEKVTSEKGASDKGQAAGPKPSDKPAEKPAAKPA